MKAQRPGEFLQHRNVDWEALIYRGIESDELDYKAAQNWGTLTRGGKAKFARHTMALANTRGGFIVVGVGEDEAGRPVLRTGLTDEWAKTFDPTDVGSFINSHTDPAIDLDIERPIVDGRQFVVFVVRRFSHLPHVCSRSLDKELQQGAFYIRTNDASSRVAFRASELHALMQRALRNQRELLGRMLRGLLYENSQYMDPESDARSRFQEQLLHSRSFQQSKTNEAPPILFDVVAYSETFEEKRFDLSQIRSAVADSRPPPPQNPFVIIGSDQETYSTNVSLRSSIPEQGQYWQAFRSGLFHFTEAVPYENTIAHATLQCLTIGVIRFLANYYAELDLQDELVHMKFCFSDVENVRLEADPTTTDTNRQRQGICRIPRIEITMERSATDLASGTDNHAARLMREITERFNLLPA